MSVPPRLVEVMVLLEDLVRGADRLRVGPARVEVEASALRPGPLPAALDLLLRRTAFLAPLLAVGQDPALLGAAAETAQRLDLFLDLRLPPGTPVEVRAFATERLVRIVEEDAAGARALFAADPLAPPAVLAESYRALFRLRPALCPFPFTTLRWRDERQALPCPRPEGPPIALVQGEDPWNVPDLRALRAAFHAGAPPPVCATCPLRERVRRSLTS